MQTAAVSRLLEENGVKLEVSDSAVRFISKAGFDPEFGARPIKRAIQRLLLNDLSKQLLAGSIDKEMPIRVDSTGDSLIFINR
jgi:ATP-dependent Clp protease ATP-binding subunit ClpB